MDATNHCHKSGKYFLPSAPVRTSLLTAEALRVPCVSLGRLVLMGPLMKRTLTDALVRSVEPPAAGRLE